MPLFLVDNNLPYYFGLWRTDDYVFVRDINPRYSDTEIWNYAMHNNLTIISKDADFSNRIMLSTPPPRVIHLKTGNLTMSQFFEYYSKNWNLIIEASQNLKLTVVTNTSITGIE
jgi:predicted nuclease of predicted toxin-antitoxin system